MCPGFSRLISLYKVIVPSKYPSSGYSFVADTLLKETAGSSMTSEYRNL